MTDLTFKINDVDFSSIVEKYSYTTNLIPVVGSKYTDLNKVDHTIITRYKGYLEVTLNPMSPSEATALFTQLQLAPCTVKYFSFQTGADVTQTMIPKWDELQDAKKMFGGHYVRSITVSFTEE